MNSVHNLWHIPFPVLPKAYHHLDELWHKHRRNPRVNYPTYDKNGVLWEDNLRFDLHGDVMRIASEVLSE